MAWPPPPPPGYLPTARPYGAGPPPPPPGSPTPRYAGPWGPAIPARGVATLQAIRQIRDAIGYFWTYLVLDLVVGVIGVLALGAAYGSGFGVVDTSGTSTASPLSGGAALAALVALAVVALGVLALLIYSYSKWRDGANDLKRAAGEFGARTAAVAIGVREDLGRATKMFVLAFVSSIVGAIAVVAVVLGAVFSSLSNLNNTTKVPTTTDHSTTLSSAVQAEVRIVVVLIVIVTTVLSILLYAYATRSHVNTIAPFASAETLARAVSGRSFAILGAILVFADVAEFFVPYGAFLGLASTAFLVYGYYQIRGAFDEVLSKPLAPNLSARPVDHLLF